MPNSKNYDLDIDTSLGGNNASDYVISSQKAIKDYVDNHSGGGTVDQIYDPTSVNAQSGVAINGAGFLQNTATGTNSLNIGGTATAYNYCVSIGSGAEAKGVDSTIIGYQANGKGIVIGKQASTLYNNVLSYGIVIGDAALLLGTSSVSIGLASSAGNYATAIGGTLASASADHSTAIGSQAYSYANSSIQIGYGTNSTAKTLSIGFYDNNTPTNYQLLDGTTGLIPLDRISVMTGADGTNAGAKGLVPQPSVTDNNKFLKGDGTWAVPPSDVFVATYGTTTYADVLTAYNAGKIIFCSQDSTITMLYSYSSSSNSFLFSRNNYTSSTATPQNLYYTLTANGWTVSIYDLEKTSNKVTSISSSSTDTQYPSAKVTYDSILKYQLNEDINTLSNGTISLSYSKPLHKRVVSANTTFTFSTTNLTLSSSVAYTFELVVTMSTAYSLTFPNSVSWQDGETPDMSATGTYYFAFRTIDAGTTWHGSLEGKW